MWPTKTDLRRFLQKLGSSDTIGYLKGSDAFRTRATASVSVGILALWLLIVVVTVMHHELWRDEVRALVMARTPASVFQLPAALRTDGHPILWYLILRTAYAVFRTQAVLPAVSIIIALSAMVVFFKCSPFPVYQKILFCFGLFPIYQYSVMSRNYGIAMLLFFLFAWLYPKRKKHPWWLGLTLALLANTNAHACFLAAILGAYWLAEAFLADKILRDKKALAHLAGGMLVVALGD